MIYFIGAGPGDPELITVRGQKLLQEAHCVIYAGSLVNPALLALCRPTCRIHNSASMTLEEVLAVMLEMEKAPSVTVRLHTGDPSMYGAIREQMDRLDEVGIPFEVVPGVSSFQGAAAALHAEYTLPGVSQTLILTRMAGRTPVPEKESIRKLAGAGASMAVFLSAGMLEELQRELLAGGYDCDTPAAIVYKATWPEEKILRTKLSDLAHAGKEAGIAKTALILVGGFLSSAYDRSLLYHPLFTHGFREGHSAPPEES